MPRKRQPKPIKPNAMGLRQYQFVAEHLAKARPHMAAEDFDLVCFFLAMGFERDNPKFKHLAWTLATGSGYAVRRAAGRYLAFPENDPVVRSPKA